ncbi:MAG: chaperone HscA, partial [Micrococcales bacterium]
MDANGDSHEYFPSIVALDGDELVYGFAAQQAAEDGAPHLRSFKRELASPEVTIQTRVRVGEREVRLLDLLTGFFDALRVAIKAALRGEAKHAVHTIVVGVPAHAHGGQRFLTLEGFRRAGFNVLGMINEPSAAGFEYTHRRSATLSAKRNKVIVYDLGGGTFDASLVHVHGTDHEVFGSRGLNRLGGDDFDAVLADCALKAAGVARTDFADKDYQALFTECRDAKERLSPQTKRVMLDVADEPVIVPVGDFYDAAAPLVETTIDVVEPFIGSLPDGSDADNLAGIYLVGGGSALPMVGRMLRERFGRRVFRSPFPAASTAIG